MKRPVIIRGSVVTNPLVRLLTWLHGRGRLDGAAKKSARALHVRVNAELDRIEWVLDELAANTDFAKFTRKWNDEYVKIRYYINYHRDILDNAPLYAFTNDNLLVEMQALGQQVTKFVDQKANARKR